MDSCLGIHQPVSPITALAAMLPQSGSTLFRDNPKNRGMHFCGIKNIPNKCSKKLKYYVVPGSYERVKNRNGRFKYLTIKQAERQGVQPSPFLGATVRVIDLDSHVTVSREQAEYLAEQIPGAGAIWTNGVQLQLRPSGVWDEDARMLCAIGRKLQAMAIRKFGGDAVWYDAHHWDRATGQAMNSERHAYRVPLGWVDGADRPPLPFHSLGGGLWTVRQAWIYLGKPRLPKLASEMPAPVEMLKKGKGKSGKTESGKQVGSLAANNAEWTTILNSFWGGIRQGLGKEGAINALLERLWEHHRPSHLQSFFGAIDITKKWGIKKYYNHYTHNNPLCGQNPDTPTIAFSGTVGPVRMLQRRFTPNVHFLQSSYELTQDYPAILVLEKMKADYKYAPIIHDVKEWLGADKWEVEALKWLEWQAVYGTAPRYWVSWDWLEQLHQVLAAYQGSSIKCDEALRLAVVALHPRIQHDWQRQGSSMRHLRRGIGILVQAGIIKKTGGSKNTMYAIPKNYRARVELRDDQLHRANLKATTATIKPSDKKKTMNTNPNPSDGFSKDDLSLLLYAYNHPVLREKFRDMLEMAGMLPPLPAEIADDIPPDVDDDDMPPDIEDEPPVPAPTTVEKELFPVPVSAPVIPARVLADDPISEAKQAKLNRRSDKNAKKLEKLRALARRKSKSTKKLQAVVQLEVDKAFRLSTIDPMFRADFEHAYLDFLLACSFEVGWDDEKKGRFARFSGFSLGECLAWIHEPDNRGNFAVSRALRFLKTTHWTKSEEVFISPKWATEEHLEALEVMADAGEVQVTEADQIRTVDILQRNLVRFCDEISTIISPEELSKVIVDGKMVDDGYFFVWRRVKELAAAKFERLFRASIAETDPLFSPSLKMFKLHIPPRPFTGSRFVHTAEIAGKERTTVPTRGALEKIKAGFAGKA